VRENWGDYICTTCAGHGNGRLVAEKGRKVGGRFPGKGGVRLKSWGISKDSGRKKGSTCRQKRKILTSKASRKKLEKADENKKKPHLTSSCTHFAADLNYIKRILRNVWEKKVGLKEKAEKEEKSWQRYERKATCGTTSHLHHLLSSGQRNETSRD